MVNKKKKVILPVIALMGVLSLASCGNNNTTYVDPQIATIYNLYVADCQAKGETPKSYDEWLKSIKGEKGDKGDKGDATEVTIGANGNWFIDGVDTGISATGPKGDKGDQGEKGDQGDTGAKGDQGEKGDKGDQGETGAKGDQGETGAAGQDGQNGHTVNPNGYKVVEKDGNYVLGHDCYDCDGVHGEVDTQPIPAVSTATFEVDTYPDVEADLKAAVKAYKSGTSQIIPDGRVDRFDAQLEFDVEDGVYKSGNTGVSSSCASAVSFTATSAGVIALSGRTGGEKQYDFMVIIKNQEVIDESYTKVTSDTDIYTFADEVEVAVDDVVSVVFVKDSSNRGMDGVEFTLPTENTVNICRFVSNNGTYIEPKLIVNGKCPVLPQPTKKDFYFDGWYDSEAYKTKVTENSALKGDQVLYAHWINLDEANPLWGTNMGVYASSSASSFSQSIDNTGIVVDFFGNFEIKTSSSSSKLSGRFVNWDPDTGIMTADNGAKAFYDVANGVVIMLTSATAPKSADLLVALAGVEKSPTTLASACSVASLDSGAERIITVGLGEKTINYFVDAANNAVTPNVTLTCLSGETVEKAADVKNVFMTQIKDADGKQVAIISLTTGSTTYGIAAANSGVYTSGGQKLYVSFATSEKGYIRYSEDTKNLKMAFTAVGNVLTCQSTGSYSYTFTIDTEAATFTAVANKLKVTLDWQGHKPEGAMEEKEYWKGSNFYTSDVPSTVADMPGDTADTVYEFGGWYKEAACENKIAYISGTNFTASFTVYAKWTLKTTYTITFDADGGTACDPMKVVEGRKVSTAGALPAPTKDGSKFVGWFTDADMTVQLTADTVITAAVTAKAKWEVTPDWATISAKTPETTMTAGLADFAGQTTANFQTFYSKVVIAEAGTYALQFVSITGWTKVGSSGSSYNARINLVNADGTAAISSATSQSTSSATKAALAAGTYYLAFNAGGNVPGSSYTYSAYATGFTAKLQKLENVDENTTLVYTLGETMAVTQPMAGMSSIYRVIKVQLEAGTYTMIGTSPTKSYTQIYLYSGWSGTSGTGSLGYCYIGSGSSTGTKTFTVTTAGTYYIATGYNCSFVMTANA